ncbi:ESX secretion-associated protein EspG [Amycolatopsis sp. CA-128772]|uniref:ESX secretion-associated protein EspG n=1 Tax=Amycolatopsis sp. CA-128772 TaxID=2073159 RepID=UPI000CD221FE|nr:ESX secretion-associated protein EspG [Amycolatopsis sp. CA-128772]
MIATFSLTTLLTAMRNVGGGDPHPVLAKGLRYIPPSATPRMNREAFEELSPFGFIQGDGFTPEFEDVLHLIDHPGEQFVAHARNTAGQIGVLIAKRSRTAVSLVCRADYVELESVDTHPADALVSKLPPCKPAGIKPFSVPQEEFQAKESDIFDEDRSREVQELDALLQRPHLGIGQLHAHDTTVSYLDLEEGRVGIALDDGYISVLPGAPRQLSQKLGRHPR